MDTTTGKVVTHLATGMKLDAASGYPRHFPLLDGAPTTSAVHIHDMTEKKDLETGPMNEVIYRYDRRTGGSTVVHRYRFAGPNIQIIPGAITAP